MIKKIVILMLIGCCFFMGCERKVETSEPQNSVEENKQESFLQEFDEDELLKMNQNERFEIKMEQRKMAKNFEELKNVMCAGCQQGKIGDTVVQDQVSYRLNSVYITRQQGDWNDISSYKPKLDENGYIQDNSLYVVANMTITVLENDCDFWWNNINLSYFDEEDCLWTQMDLSSVSQLKDDTNPDIFHESLPIGEEVTRNIVWVLEAEQWQEKNHYFVGLNSHGVGYEDLKATEYSMFYLESMEGLYEETVQTTNVQ